MALHCISIGRGTSSQGDDGIPPLPPSSSSRHHSFLSIVTILIVTITPFNSIKLTPVKAYWALRPTLSSLLSPLSSLYFFSLSPLYISLIPACKRPIKPYFLCFLSLLSCFLTWYQSAAAAVSDRKLRVCPKTPPPSSAAVLTCDVAAISRIRWYRSAVGLRIDLRTSCGRRRPALSCDAVALLRSRPARRRPARLARRRPARPTRSASARPASPARPARRRPARPARRRPAHPACTAHQPPLSPAKRRRLALLALLASTLLALLTVALTH